jgi:signal transduction histidine kinase
VKPIPLALPVAVLWLVASRRGQTGNAASIAIDAAKVENRISPRLYGQFAEFMFENIKFGLHAELLRNRGFEETANAIGLPRHWERHPGGIDPALLSMQAPEGCYGLGGMRERAAVVGGRLAVWSEVGAGTEVELRLPASTVYATSPRRSWWSRLVLRKTAARAGGDIER